MMSDLPLIRRAAAGELDAWQELQAAVGPTVQAMARRHRGMRRNGIATQADDVGEVVASTLERLARDGFANLRRFIERSEQSAGGQSFDGWLYGLVDFVVREHLRQRLGRALKSEVTAAHAGPRKRDLESHASHFDEVGLDYVLNTLVQANDDAFGAEDALNQALDEKSIFSKAGLTLTANELRALVMRYREDADFAQIAEELCLPDAMSAARIVRRAVARLRHANIEQPAGANGRGSSSHVADDQGQQALSGYVHSSMAARRASRPPGVDAERLSVTRVAAFMKVDARALRSALSTARAEQGHGSILAPEMVGQRLRALDRVAGTLMAMLGSRQGVEEWFAAPLDGVGLSPNALILAGKDDVVCDVLEAAFLGQAT